MNNINRLSANLAGFFVTVFSNEIIFKNTYLCGSKTNNYYEFTRT